MPVRSYGQLARKIWKGAEALERNRGISPGIGESTRKTYSNHLCQGTLPTYYDSLRSSPTVLADQLAQGGLNRGLAPGAEPRPFPAEDGNSHSCYRRPLSLMHQCL